MRSDWRSAATSESDRVVSARGADNISPLLILIKALRMFLFLTLLRAIVSESLDEQEFQKAKQEYEQAVPPGNEKARLTYVSKLAQIADRLGGEFRQSGQRNDEAMSAMERHKAVSVCRSRAGSEAVSPTRLI